MKEGSVAPKERVNIVYRPAIGDAAEDVELPLKVLVLGDFTMQEDEDMVEDRKPINIDKNNFNNVMEALNLQLNISIPDALDDDPEAKIPVNLKFNKVSDFKPENIAPQVPEMSKLLELRQSLKALKGPLGNVPAFRKKLQSIVSDEDVRKNFTS